MSERDEQRRLDAEVRLVCYGMVGYFICDHCGKQVRVGVTLPHPPMFYITDGDKWHCGSCALAIAPPAHWKAVRRSSAPRVEYQLGAYRRLHLCYAEDIQREIDDAWQERQNWRAEQAQRKRVS
jgi:hypothetical protein